MNTQTTILHSSIHVSKTQRIMLNILKKNIYTSKSQNIIFFCMFCAVLFNAFTRKKREIPSFSFQVNILFVYFNLRFYNKICFFIFLRRFKVNFFIDSFWFKVTVASHTSTCWDDLTDDDIFLKSKEMVLLTTDSRVCKDTSCLLEGSS